MACYTLIKSRYRSISRDLEDILILAESVTTFISKGSPMGSFNFRQEYQSEVEKTLFEKFSTLRYS